MRAMACRPSECRNRANFGRLLMSGRLVGASGWLKGTLTMPSKSLMSNTTALPPAARQRRINSTPRRLPAMYPVR